MAKRRPSTSRRQFLKAAAIAPAALIPTVAAAEQPPWQPTELGREVVRQLMPYLEALTRRACINDDPRSPDFDAGKLAAAELAEEQADAAYFPPIKAILDAAATDPRKHLVDLAIVARCGDDGCGSQCGYRDKAVDLLARAVLGMSSVPAAACDQNPIARRIERQFLAERRAQDGVVVPFRPRGRVA